MNNRAELVQAFEDLQAGRLGTIPADGLRPTDPEHRYPLPPHEPRRPPALTAVRVMRDHLPWGEAPHRTSAERQERGGL